MLATHAPKHTTRSRAVSLRTPLRSVVPLRKCSYWQQLRTRAVQQTHYQANDKPLSGHQWTRNLILFFWDEANELWSQRNNDIHDPTLALQHQDLVQQVEELYALEPHTLAEDRDNFLVYLTTRLTQTTQQLHNFIQSQGPVIRYSVCELVRQTEASFHSIRNLFTTRQ
jgi:hypothetical protein